MMVDDAPLKPVLDHNDLRSSTWGKLRRHIQARIESLRKSNDNDQSPTDTAALRGQIRALTNLLALGDPDPAIAADED